MGQLSVRELMAVIAASHAVVSEPQARPILPQPAEFRMLVCSIRERNNLPTRWQPLGKGVVLRPEVPTCEKCIYEACPYWDCLDRLTVESSCAAHGQVVGDPSPLRVLHV